jgi:NAD+ diphosphatase
MNFNFCPACGKQGTVQKQDDTNYECSNCQWHFWNNAKAATALIFIKGDQALFAKRAREPKKGMYDFPGGFVDFGETAEESAIREAKEELGITIRKEDLELLAIYGDDYDFPGTHVFSTDIVYVVRQWEGDFRPQDDVAAVSWHPFHYIDDRSFFTSDYSGLSGKLASRVKSSSE